MILFSFEWRDDCLFYRGETGFRGVMFWLRLYSLLGIERRENGDFGERLGCWSVWRVYSCR